MISHIDDTSYYEQEVLWDSSRLTENPREACRIKETVQLIPSDVRTVLDVGSGDGALVRYLQLNYERLNQIVAFDRSKAALTHVEDQRICGSCDTIPVKDMSFDCVLACEVLEHLPLGIFEKTLNELYRVSRRYILITVPNAEDRNRARLLCPYCGCVFHRYRHVRSFRPSDLTHLFPSFTPINMKPIGPPESLYSHWVLALAKKIGIIRSRIPGNPICPQCGFDRFNAPKSSPLSSEQTRFTTSGFPRRLSRLRHILTPKKTRQPWLAILYRRTASEEVL